MPERATLLAGVGGTVTVLASIDRDLPEYDPAALEGWYIERDKTHLQRARPAPRADHYVHRR